MLIEMLAYVSLIINGMKETMFQYNLSFNEIIELLNRLRLDERISKPYSNNILKVLKKYLFGIKIQKLVLFPIHILILPMIVGI